MQCRIAAFRSFVFVCAIALLRSGVRGDESPNTTGSHVSDVVQRLKAQWDSAPSLDESRDELEGVMSELRKFLSTLAHKQEAWKSYLMQNAIEAELSKPHPSADILEDGGHLHSAVETTLARLDGYPDVAGQLVKFSRRLRLAETTYPTFETKLGVLEECLAGRTSELTDDGYAKLAEVTSWLVSRGFDEDLVAEENRPFRQRNVAIQCSSDLLNAAVERRESFQSPVNSVILGTRYEGTSWTDSRLQLRPLSDDLGLSLEFGWGATVVSSTRGYRGPVTIRSQGTTWISGRKPIRIDGSGYTPRPASVGATTSSRVLSVSSGRLLGQRLARRQVDRDRATTERRVSRIAEQRARRELDTRIGQLVDETLRTFDQRIRVPFAERGQSASDVVFNSSEKRIGISLLQADGGQLGAMSAVPEHWLAKSDFDLSLVFHASSLNNLAQGYFAGREYAEEDLAREVKRMLGRVPSGLRRATDQPMWRIQFDKHHPLTFKVDQQTCTIEIRANELTVGDRSIPGSWIKAEYELSTDTAGLIGQRKGKLSIVPADNTQRNARRVGARYQVYRTMLRKRFERILPESFRWKQFDLFGLLPEERRLSFADCAFDSQWIRLACQLTPPQVQQGTNPGPSEPQDPSQLTADTRSAADLVTD